MNFVRVLKGLLVSQNGCMPLLQEDLQRVLSAALGGERHRSSLNHNTGYSAKAQRNGTQSCLEPNSQSLQKTVGEGGRIGAFSPQNHVEKDAKTRTYLEPNRDSMHEPIGGRSMQHPCSLYKRGYRLFRAQKNTGLKSLKALKKPT